MTSPEVCVSTSDAENERLSKSVWHRLDDGTNRSHLRLLSPSHLGDRMPWNSVEGKTENICTITSPTHQSPHRPGASRPQRGPGGSSPCTRCEHGTLKAVHHSRATPPGWILATYLIVPETVIKGRTDDFPSRPVSVGVLAALCLLCHTQGWKLLLAKQSCISVTPPSLHQTEKASLPCSVHFGVLSVYFGPFCLWKPPLLPTPENAHSVLQNNVARWQD